MTNTQLWLAIGVPSFLILVGILLNQSAISSLRAEILSRFAGVEAHFTGIENRLIVIEGDLRRFYQLIGEHSGKIESLERKQA